MLSIQPSQPSPQKCTPNLLPARINHNGRINNTQRYWTPETDDKGKQHAYFRGRHLHGTTLPLPEGYTGAVLQVTDKVVPKAERALQEQEIEDEDEDGEDMVQEENAEVKIAEKVGEFDEIVVWEHGGSVDGAQNMFVRSMEEWIGFAESMHVDEEESLEKRN